MYTYLLQALLRVVIHRTQVVKEKWKLRIRLTPTKENCIRTKISTKTDKDGFSPAEFRARFEQKTPVTECLVHRVCVLFSMGKSMLRMGSCVRFCCHNILFLRTFPLVSALLANQKLIFDERISCITRHDDFSPRSDRTVSLQVAPFLGDCKGKGYRHRAGQMENEWVYRHQISLK